ncbi:MAG: DUF4389 domain-containing protein [Acidimicrobiales bacterium]
MILRYSTRASMYGGFMHDSFPPFDFAMTATEPGGTPVDIEFTPALVDRDRLTVGLRFLWAIPALLYVMAITIVGAICWVVALFAVVATGKWPEALRSWVMKMNRVTIRFDAYALLLTDEYPPFTTD